MSKKIEEKLNKRSICSLCQRKKRLVNSHIIPRFAIKWLKATSGAGYLRRVVNPNLRIQDSVKIRLLCNKCEGRISILENYFAREIFYPYQKNRYSTFQYDSRLKDFLISLSWRIMCSEEKPPQKMGKELKKSWIETKEVWRRYLSGESSEFGPYEHHIFFLDFVSPGTGKELPNKFQWYTMRTIDATTAFSDIHCFVYVKMPAIFFISSIYPIELEDLEETKVNFRGTIGPPQKIGPDLFDFLLSRVKLTTNLQVSPKQKKIINESIIGNEKRFLKSKSMEVWLKEIERKRSKGKEEY